MANRTTHSIKTITPKRFMANRKFNKIDNTSGIELNIFCSILERKSDNVISPTRELISYLVRKSLLCICSCI